MATISIVLDETQITQLKRLAEQRGQTMEQMVQSMLNDILLAAPAAQPNAQQRGATLALAGIIDDRAIPPLTAREIDEVLADEFADSHESQHGQ